MTTHTFPRSSSITKPKGIHVASSCSRCGGQGGWQGWPGFTCFRCRGNGQDPVGQKIRHFPATWTDEECQAYEDKLAARRQAKAEAKAQAAQELIKTQVAAIPSLAQLLAWREAAPVWDMDADAYGEGDDTWFMVGSIASDIVTKAHRYELSERQVAVLGREVASVNERIARKAARAEEAAQAGPVPAGVKVTITGEVVGRKWHETEFGGSMKLTVKLANGSRIWFTEPRSAETTVGDVIECLLSEVKASDKDESFGFGKRPTRFNIIKSKEEAA